MKKKIMQCLQNQISSTTKRGQKLSKVAVNNICMYKLR
jgi:hypothetical protein